MTHLSSPRNDPVIGSGRAAAVRHSLSRPTVKTSTVAATVFAVCLFLRCPRIFLSPRFWAEEGSLYFAQLQHLSFGQALTFVANGNYQLATNVTVGLSLLGRTRDAAVITTYVPFVLDILCCVLIARFMAARSCSRVSIVVASALFALQVTGYEVFLNATNVQWVCSAITLFLFLEPEIPASSPGAFGRYLSVAALGLTGVTSCILLPVTIAIALALRSRIRTVMVLVLLAASLAQLAVILTHSSNEGRSYSLSLASLIPLALQGVFSAFLPVSSLDAIGAALLAPDRFASAARFQVALVGLAALDGIAAGAVESLGRFRTAILLATAIFATAMNEFGALGDVGDFMSAYGGSRYFFLASTCVIVMLAAGLNGRSAWKRRASAAAVMVVAVNLVLTAAAGPLPSIFFKGRSFAAQVDGCAAATSCTVYGWPDVDWTHFEISPNRLR